MFASLFPVGYRGFLDALQNASVTMPRKSLFYQELLQAMSEGMPLEELFV
ncbi:MAG: hypothetical protein HGB36_13950 [Chlorobiaceae bacterium]|nr:hypothetical protein [Chlorobiaceae bacterium]